MMNHAFRARRRIRRTMIAGTWLAGLIVGAVLMTAATLALTPDPITALLEPAAPVAPESTPVKPIQSADAS